MQLALAGRQQARRRGTFERAAVAGGWCWRLAAFGLSQDGQVDGQQQGLPSPPFSPSLLLCPFFFFGGFNNWLMPFSASAIVLTHILAVSQNRGGTTK